MGPFNREKGQENWPYQSLLNALKMPFVQSFLMEKENSGLLERYECKSCSDPANFEK